MIFIGLGGTTPPLTEALLEVYFHNLWHFGSTPCPGLGACTYLLAKLTADVPRD